MLVAFAFSSAISGRNFSSVQNEASGSLINNKAPTYLPCRCDDFTIYSYGNECKTGWQGCERNPCPAPPAGCAGGAGH